MLLLLLHRMQRAVPQGAVKVKQGKKKKAVEHVDQGDDESAEDQDQQCEAEQSGKHL